MLFQSFFLKEKYKNLFVKYIFFKYFEVFLKSFEIMCILIEYGQVQI